MKTTLLLSLLSLTAFAYPTPPWTRQISAVGHSWSEYNAVLQCRRDALRRVRSLESACLNHGGVSSSTAAGCLTCVEKADSGYWYCKDSVAVTCRKP